jgi:cellulose synthase/poly-beta-1,6-N-acetylglucosamine synthase-like glycosyltransferase
VDSGSSDGSVSLATAMGAETISLRSARPTAALGRNAGWKGARGEFILFLDGDTVLDPHFVSDALPEFLTPSIAVIWGHRREIYPRASLYNRVLDLDWVYAPGLTPFCGGDALFRRSVLEATGGFDDTLIAGEEPELCRRILSLGGQILHVDHAMTGHDLNMHKFRQYWKRATRAGHAFAEVSSRYADTPNPFWLAEARANRTRASILVILPFLALAVGAYLKSIWPISLLAAMLSLIVIRTARKARWKTSDRLALLLYGVHSHFQQIPILIGQLQYRLSRCRGTRTALVEYKQG